MKPLFDAPLAIVDVETTGAGPAWDRVTEIAVLEVADGEVLSEWSTLVNPGTPIPPWIQALTGITNRMVADAPAFEELAAKYGKVFGKGEAAEITAEELKRRKRLLDSIGAMQSQDSSIACAEKSSTLFLPAAMRCRTLLKQRTW